MALRKCLSFLLNGGTVELDRVPTDRTLLDFLRLDRRLTGTKEGCAEGACGACTVLVGSPCGDRVDYAPVNACIRPLATLHGQHVVTVEHLGGREGSHPVQRAMVELNGSQCGFCTPGIVMALAADRLQGGGDPETALQGNLCRCTGYGPIIEAARQAAADPAPDPLADDAATAARLAALEDGADLAVEGPGGTTTFAPASADSFARLLVEHGGARVLAGATDLALEITKGLKQPPVLVHIGRVRGFDRLAEEADGLHIGPAVTFACAMPVLDRLYPELAALWRRIGGPQVRHAGTIAGNIANGSPIGDSPPALIALGARLVLRRGERRRELPLEDYFIAYGRQDRAPGEFIEEVIVPPRPPGALIAAHKVSKRRDEDISTVMGAFCLMLDGGRVRQARIAFGGMAGTPKRAGAVEAALIGQPWTRETVIRAQAAFAQDYQPLSDWRGTAAYRLTVARNLLMRVHAEAEAAHV